MDSLFAAVPRFVKVEAVSAGFPDRRDKCRFIIVVPLIYYCVLPVRLRIKLISEESNGEPSFLKIS